MRQPITGGVLLKKFQRRSSLILQKKRRKYRLPRPYTAIYIENYTQHLTHNRSIFVKKIVFIAHMPDESGSLEKAASVIKKYDGNIHKVLHVYNATCTPGYEREVIKAYQQACFNAVCMPPYDPKALRDYRQALSFKTSALSSGRHLLN